MEKKKICIITVSYKTHSFESEFPLDRDVPEYMLADEAWRVALLFAQTQAFANSLSVMQVLEQLDYDYKVQEG